ncbi:hypothetical protein QJS10_CPA01g02101 [Acorus calamus]|uniref:Uncharacterized protein n=1 Tax=Acorus calamus TaxID=4465 RepID=A0AAV9FFV8_ACOCL|nr:hypothetical protein QJS10_CPA01g02101 [Acorus calamus]
MRKKLKAIREEGMLEEVQKIPSYIERMKRKKRTQSYMLRSPYKNTMRRKLPKTVRVKKEAIVEIPDEPYEIPKKQGVRSEFGGGQGRNRGVGVRDRVGVTEGYGRWVWGTMGDSGDGRERSRRRNRRCWGQDGRNGGSLR